VLGVAAVVNEDRVVTRGHQSTAVAVLAVLLAVSMLIVMGNQLAARRLLRTREVLRAMRKR
jgi:hypothetical protein